MVLLIPICSSLLTLDVIWLQTQCVHFFQMSKLYIIFHCPYFRLLTNIIVMSKQPDYSVIKWIPSAYPTLPTFQHLEISAKQPPPPHAHCTTCLEHLVLSCSYYQKPGWSLESTWLKAMALNYSQAWPKRLRKYSRQQVAHLYFSTKLIQSHIGLPGTFSPVGTHHRSSYKFTQV